MAMDVTADAKLRQCRSNNADIQLQRAGSPQTALLFCPATIVHRAWAITTAN
jgi:hypothetical protein